MKDKPKKPEQDQSAEVVDPQDVIAVSQEQGDGFRDRAEGDVLKEGQFAVFRWSDADQYDPEGTQWFVGIILEVRYPDKEEFADVEQDENGCCPNCGERVEYPSYRVLCEDGIERSFMAHEEYYPNAAWDEALKQWVPGEDAWMAH